MKEEPGLESTITASRADDASAPALPPSLERRAALGRYIILEQLGHGGMGIVYSAYDPDLDRKVAVKVLRREMIGSEERLLREARAMARLQHSNVIVVHDVGRTDESVFIAMELVDGTTLGGWLAAAPRSWREILAMFVAAGRGLAAAHSVGIVHRDFKPSNVLVDGEGRVRVADFGVARASEADRDLSTDATTTASLSSPGAATITRTGTLLGTPTYMSPEQLLGTPASTASDQFSFCVALYRALYGERPFIADDIKTLADEIAHGRVKPPPKSSEVPAWIGEVVLRGLAFAPEDRFSSMEALLAALDRDTKRARRQWLTVAAVAVVVASLSAGVVSAVRRERAVCHGGERRLAGVWDDTRRAAVQSAFLATGKSFAADSYRSVARALDDYAHAWVSAYTDACEANHVRRDQSDELLDLRMQCLDTSLQSVKAQADLFAGADAKIVEKAAQMTPSLPNLATCSDIATLRAPVRPPADADARARVAQVRADLARARALKLGNRFEAAKTLALQSVTAAQRLHYRPLEAEALLVTGMVEEALGDATAQKTLEDAAFAARAGRDAATEIEVAATMINVAQDQARFDLGHHWGQHGMAAFEALGSSDERPLSSLLENLGTLLADEGKFDEALADVRRSLAIREQTFGPESQRVAQSYIDLALIVGMQGHFVDAESYARRALSLYEKLLGPDSPDVGWSWFQIAYAQAGEGRLEDALASYRRTVANWEKVVGPEHPRLSLPLTNIGDLLTRLNRYDEALAYNRRSLAIAEKNHGVEHPDAALARVNIADVLRRQGKYEDALVEFERARAIWEKALGPEHHYVADALTGIGMTELDRHEPSRALPSLERALTIREKQHAGPADTALTCFALARAQWEAGRGRVGARKMATRAREGYASAGPSAKKELAEVEAWLASHR